MDAFQFENGEASYFVIVVFDESVVAVFPIACGYCVGWFIEVKKLFCVYLFCVCDCAFAQEIFHCDFIAWLKDIFNGNA